MNAIAKTSKNPRSLSPTVDRGAAAALIAARNGLFSDYPAMPKMLAAPLAPALRAVLELRSRDLQQWLAPAAKHEYPRMAAAVSGMLGAFGGNIAGSPEALVSKYIQVLQDLPLWAVVAACRALENGEVEGASLDFRPTAPRLKQVAKALMADWSEEAYRIQEVLIAPALAPEDEHMRQRLAALFSDFANNLRMGKFKPAPEPEPEPKGKDSPA